MKRKTLMLMSGMLFSHFAHCQWSTGSTNNLYYNAGNVGVGTTTPSARLSVYEPSNLGLNVKNIRLLTSVGGLAGNSNRYMNNIWLVRNGVGDGWVTATLHNGISIDTSFLAPQSNTRTWWERDPYSNVQSWGTAAETYMIINNGNVGIGTKDPMGYKLAVAGSIIATSVNVRLQSQWPDYVFKKGYMLPTLPEVEAYIKKNKRLPDMPSEQEVVKNGVNLGEIIRLQTQKIEELMLYLIEKDKRLKQQDERIKRLERLRYD